MQKETICFCITDICNHQAHGPFYLWFNMSDRSRAEWYDHTPHLTLTVLVATTDAQWEGMGDVGSARYEPALLPPCPTIRVLSYSN